MNITCMRIKTLKPIFFRRKGVNQLCFTYYTLQRETMGAFYQLSQPSQQGGDLTCQKVPGRPCSPTTFTLLPSSPLSLSKSSHSVIGEKIDRSYRYVQALSFSEIKGYLNSKLNQFFVSQHLCSNKLRLIPLFYLPLRQCQTENMSSGALIINNEIKNS